MAEHVAVNHMVAGSNPAWGDHIFKTFNCMKRVSIMKQPVLSIVNEHVSDYPSPSNLNYFWSFGSIAGICLVVQIATGIFLAMHYTPHVDLAFASV